MSSEARHTPGPWEVLGPIRKRPNDPPYFVIFHEDIEISRQKNEGNARLIAAAPELLDAAGAVLTVICGPHEEMTGNPYPAKSAGWWMIHELQQSVAKAEGREAS